MKAHIAKNQYAGVPTLLTWNLSTADHGKLTGMAPAFGMRLLTVRPSDANQTVAALLEEKRAAAAELPAAPLQTPAVLFSGFRDRDLDTLLDLMKQAECSIPLKAVATPDNLGWTWAALLAHISAERAAMQNGAQ